MRVWRRQNQVKLNGMGCIESSPCLVLWPVWPALHIARSMPVFDSCLALILKGFLLTRSSENPCFRNSGIGPSDHPDGIRVIPETLYLRAFPRFWGALEGASEVTRSGELEQSSTGIGTMVAIACLHTTIRALRLLPTLIDDALSSVLGHQLAISLDASLPRPLTFTQLRFARCD